MHLEDALIRPRFLGNDLRVRSRLVAAPATSTAATNRSGLIAAGRWIRWILRRFLRLRRRILCPDRIVGCDDGLRATLCKQP